MALNAKITTREIDGKNEEVFTIEFTNGTLKQLKDLGDFLKTDGFPISTDETDKLKEVVSVGIGWLERVKETRSKEGSDKIS